MSRPIYCRDEDRKNEARVMEIFIARLRRDAAKVGTAFSGDTYGYVQGGKLDPYDAIIARNSKNYAFVEIKSRTGDGNRYAEWHIAKHKIERCLEAAKAQGLRFFLVFAWDGKPFMCDVSKLDLSKLQVRVGGRYDRNDAADVEEMYLIPSNLFKAI